MPSVNPVYALRTSPIKRTIGPFPRAGHDKAILPCLTMCMSKDVIPDFEWYSAISAKRGMPTPRCPFASAERCPLYHHSLSLFGDAGFTKMDPAERPRLQRRWPRLGLLPKTDEQATGTTSSTDASGRRTTNSYSNFCPEVSREGFGYFASGLYRHSDELDGDLAHRRLRKMQAPSNHWGWAWAAVSPMHYSECPYYSLLSAPTPAASDDGAADVTLKFPGIVDVRFKWRAKEAFKVILDRLRRKLPSRA